VRDVVYHGLDVDAFPAAPAAGSYLAFIGRSRPEKGPHLAIDAASPRECRCASAVGAHWVNEGFFESECRRLA